MHLILLMYKKPMLEIEKHLSAHKLFLDEQYATGKFIFSGPQNPRIGGVILAKDCDKIQLDTILAKDPFFTNQIAEYEIIEFTPTKYLAAFESFALNK